MADERTCLTCRWWEVWLEPDDEIPGLEFGMGRCLLISQALGRSHMNPKALRLKQEHARASADYMDSEYNHRADLWTYGDFGCTEWDERQLEYPHEQVTAFRLAHPEKQGWLEEGETAAWVDSQQQDDSE